MSWFLLLIKRFETWVKSLTLFCCNKRFWSRAWQVRPYRLAWPDISPLIGQCCYICPLIGHRLPWLGRISLFDQNVNTQSRRTKIWSLGQFLFILDWVSQLFGKYPSQISNESMSPSLASHWLDTCLSLVISGSILPSDCYLDNYNDPSNLSTTPRLCDDREK